MCGGRLGLQLGHAAVLFALEFGEGVTLLTEDVRDVGEVHSVFQNLDVALEQRRELFEFVGFVGGVIDRLEPRFAMAFDSF
jgi:hypothetical protein